MFSVIKLHPTTAIVVPPQKPSIMLIIHLIHDFNGNILFCFLRHPTVGVREYFLDLGFDQAPKYDISRVWSHARSRSKDNVVGPRAVYKGGRRSSRCFYVIYASLQLEPFLKFGGFDGARVGNRNKILWNSIAWQIVSNFCYLTFMQSRIFVPSGIVWSWTDQRLGSTEGFARRWDNSQLAGYNYWSITYQCVFSTVVRWVTLPA